MAHLKESHEHLTEFAGKMDVTVAGMSHKVDENSLSLKIIEQQTEPLTDIADGVRALRTLAKFTMYLGGIAAAGAAILQFVNGI